MAATTLAKSRGGALGFGNNAVNAIVAPSYKARVKGQRAKERDAKFVCCVFSTAFLENVQRRRKSCRRCLP